MFLYKCNSFLKFKIIHNCTTLYVYILFLVYLLRQLLFNYQTCNYKSSKIINSYKYNKNGIEKNMNKTLRTFNNFLLFLN